MAYGTVGSCEAVKERNEYMAYTWADLRSEIVDLGFEEDSITTEYARLIRNSTNRALDLIYHTVVPQIEDYYKLTESWGYEDSDGEWTLPKPRHITENTADEDVIGLAKNLQPLIPLLASHYVWLDDDIQKATMYWNEYDQLKDIIIQTCNRPRKAVIEGGIRW